MPYGDVEAIFGPGATGIEVKLRDVYRADKAREQLLRQLGPGYFGRTWIEMNRNLFSALKLEKLIMFIILALIIFVASFNIISSLVMTVVEKRKDIAIMRAMGAKWQSIMRIFMVEGVTIGIVGVFIGFMSGWIMCEIQRRFKVVTLPEDVYNLSALPVKISLPDMLLVVAVTLAICFASTLYPSFKAAKIDPVETLRYE
jgi:lipoprotein-releasing system permease protein